MKNKILAVIISATLALPMSACIAAESGDAWKSNTGTVNLNTMSVSGEGISAANGIVTITKGGDFEVTGTLEDGMIYINSEEKVKLRLSSASITNSTGPAIFFDNAEKALITITEGTENYLTDGKEYTAEDADAPLFSNDDLEIKGNGTLYITANYQHGIAGDDDVSIENGTIVINSSEHGIKVNDTLSVTGGNITVKSETGKGMKADLEVIIDGGNIDVTSLASEGIESKGTLTVNGGNISVTAYDDGLNTGNPDTDEDTLLQGGFGGREQGNIPSDAAQKQNGNGQRFDRGQMTTPEQGQMPQLDREQMTPSEQGQMPQSDRTQMNGGGRGGFGFVDEETAAARALTINGGTIYINANGDGIDSNGNLTITGGNITVDGPLNAGNGPLDCDGTMSITGGTVVLASSAGMVQLPGNGDSQNILSVMFTEKKSADTEIVIKETDSGNEIINHTPKKDFQSFVFSSDKITEGTKYTVYADGIEYQTVTAVAGTTSAGSANMQGGFGGRGFFGNRQNMQNSRIRVTLDGKNIRFDTDPVLENGTTLVGFRAILEALGATVEWNRETKTVTAKKDETEIILKIGSATAIVNGEEKTLLRAPEIINDSTMIPVRFVSEQFNMNVEWNGDTKLITITSK